MKVGLRLPNSRPRRPYFSLARTTIERPSGVSSASEASCAAFARFASATFGQGRNVVAWRVPRVIVLVLFRKATSTSADDASERPDKAIRFLVIVDPLPANPSAQQSPT